MPSSPQAPVYPRTYRATLKWRILFVGLGVLVMLAGAAGAVYFGTGHEMRTPQQAVGFTVGALLFVLLGAAVAAGAALFRLVLTADAIEARGAPLRTWRLQRDQIAGRRRAPAEQVPTLVLVPRPPRRKPFKLPLIFEPDEAFKAWVDALPDLDTAEWRGAETEIAATSSGSGLDLTRARLLAKTVNVAAVVASVWGFRYPRPYGLAMAVLAIFPAAAVAIVARWPGFFRFEGRRGDPHPQVFVAFALPACALALRAVLDIHVLDERTLFAAVLAGGAVIAIVMTLIDPDLRKSPWKGLLFLLITGAYAFGAISMANALLDRSPARVVQTKVVDKHVNHGRQTTYHIKLMGPFPGDATRDPIVSGATYERLQPGDAVAVTIRSGALGISWFVLNDD